MLNALYTLIIYPLEILMEVVFSTIYDMSENAGLSIIGVSLVLNILLLPLYNRADKISEEERNKQKEMQPIVSHIKKTFKGDERFMMLQTYYRKQDYHPLYSLRSSFPLLLQIPFFIAAYHFLSNLSLLNDCLFGIIRDLGKPDTMIVIPRVVLNIYTEKHLMEPLTVSVPSVGEQVYPVMLVCRGFCINVLPLLMTAINIVSILVYTKGSSLKEKIQLYVMAGLFLVLLYKSPSGLVVYWIMNNVFSLIKNIVYGLKKKLSSDQRKTVDEDKAASRSSGSISGRGSGGIFFVAALVLSLLTGVLIPSSVIVSSPTEFVITTAYKNPLHYIVSTALIAAGMFLIWIPIFYYFASPKIRSAMSAILAVLAGVALVDYMAFGGLNVYVSARLKYEAEVILSDRSKLINLAVVLFVIILVIILFLKRQEWLRAMYIVLATGIIILASVNMIRSEEKIASNINELKASADDYKGFTLSKHGRNVVVLMLDRYMGPYLPYVLNEKPELADRLSGFVYYPNTVSFGGSTGSGSAALFGGYEYTTGALDERNDEKLVDKHDEALSVMPVVFSKNGYETTVYDPPLAGFQWVPDLSIYEDYPDIHAYNLSGKFVDPAVVDFIEKYRKRSFFMYSIHKSAPLFIQMAIYDEGEYLYPDNLSFPEMDFFNSYSTLQNLSNITKISDSDTNTFMMMDNETPHHSIKMQLPDYTFSGNVNNNGLEYNIREDAEGNQIQIEGFYNYYGQMASMMRVCDWLDFLRESGVYDNTRIIIVSDHGNSLEDFEELILDDGTDIEGVIPLLMYKDFDANEPFSTSEEFMTNADTPTLAMKDILPGAVNPFTGNIIDDHEKTEHDQLILCSPIIGADDRDKTTYYSPGQPWYTVHDNVYDKRNWIPVDFGDRQQGEAP